MYVYLFIIIVIIVIILFLRISFHYISLFYKNFAIYGFFYLFPSNEKEKKDNDI